MALPTQISSFSRPLFGPAQGRKPFKAGRGISVPEIYAQREGNPSASYGDGTPVPFGTPINAPTWNLNSGRGRYGVQQPRSRISSAGVAGGVPTSEAGRFEQYGEDAIDIPAHELSAMLREEEGLSRSNRYGGMGRIPPPVPPVQMPVEERLGKAAAMKNKAGPGGQNLWGFGTNLMRNMANSASRYFPSTF